MSARRLGSRSRGAVLAGAAMLASAFAAWPAFAQTPSSAPAAQADQAPASSPEDVERLRERAAQFWAARVAMDATKQWELLEPRGRGRMTPAEYGGVPRAVKYLAYQVEDAAVRGYFATVQVRLIVQPMLPTAPQKRVAPAAVVIQETWVKIKGTWYRSLEQDSGRPAMTAQQ